MTQKTKWIGMGNAGRGGLVNVPTASEHLHEQVRTGRVRIGPEAAREIARRIEDQGGFW